MERMVQTNWADRTGTTLFTGTGPDSIHGVVGADHHGGDGDDSLRVVPTISVSGSSG